jgi:hypothetical protein|tara:strand:- start:358 stop:474 length:117 start_codon:yes stop_codon:yes gene_type:complete
MNYNVTGIEGRVNLSRLDEGRANFTKKSSVKLKKSSVN